MKLRTIQAQTSGDTINFSFGIPGPSLLPLEAIREAAEHRLSQGDPAPLQYGYEQGDAYFRRALGKFLGEKYRTPVDPDELFVSNGVSQALDLICTLHTRQGDLIFVEEPSYPLALRIFADHRLRVVSLPMDDRGLVVSELEERLLHGRPVLLYTVPTHQNPAGATLPLERRRRLLELSQEHGFLILADEVYHPLSYTEEPPPPMASFISEGPVFSLGSFSKILAPGLRLGWVQASRKLLEPLVSCGMLDSGGGLNPFTSSVVRSFLELGFQEEHLEKLKGVYRKRLEAVESLLADELAGSVSYRVPRGGFFFWLKLTDGTDAEELLAAAQRHKVGFIPGIRFSSRQGLRNRLRLSFSYYEEERLQEGVHRLAEAIRRKG
jgi:DNA-binding transcriptional MocR family regulator